MTFTFSTGAESWIMLGGRSSRADMPNSGRDLPKGDKRIHVSDSIDVTKNRAASVPNTLSKIEMKREKKRLEEQRKKLAEQEKRDEKKRSKMESKSATVNARMMPKNWDSVIRPIESVYARPKFAFRSAPVAHTVSRRLAPPHHPPPPLPEHHYVTPDISSRGVYAVYNRHPNMRPSRQAHGVSPHRPEPPLERDDDSTLPCSDTSFRCVDCLCV